VRTYRRPNQAGVSGRPEAVIILIPGFLGGATTFDPLARDLAFQGQGRITVWAVDRRPNQLEDQLGGNHARDGAQAGDLNAIFEGAQFYFADTNALPLDDFPGPDDLDVNLNGVDDPQTPLTDGFGNERLPVLFTQDDVRPFMAHWGIDLYMRDWMLLVDKARALVGEDGVVLLGGHSQGTTWASIFAAYDFDPTPAVDPGYAHIDGLILLEGGGVRPAPCSSTPPPGDADAYLTEIAGLETPGGPDVFLQDLIINNIPALTLIELGTVGQVAAIAGVLDPDAPALIQRTPTFNGGLLAFIFFAPATNQTIAGLFLDDDFSPNPAFRATMGFSDNGRNLPFSGAYIAQIPRSGALRSWKDFNDATLPVCEPGGTTLPNVRSGCAINTDPSLGGDPRDREVTPINNFLRSQYETNNGFEWYFADGRVSTDFRFCNDSSALGDESLLAITQNANVDIPVLGIGGSNGLAPVVSSFDTYLGSIATAAADTHVCILDGYAHVDPLTAANNESVPLILDMVDALKNGDPLSTALTCTGSPPPAPAP
jgi:pimeloyl-ACP methyl ester carboxylesterase